MNRREALSAVSFLLGGTIIGSELFLSGCARENKTVQNGLFDDDTIAFLDEVGETILPATSSSPGAKETHIGEFMNAIVTDCYNESDQKVFREGIVKLNDTSKISYAKDFMSLTPEEKHSLLLGVDKE